MITKRQLRRILRTEGYIDGEYPAKVVADRWVRTYARGFGVNSQWYRDCLIETPLMYQYMQHNKVWLGEP